MIIAIKLTKFDRNKATCKWVMCGSPKPSGTYLPCFLVDPAAFLHRTVVMLA